MGIVITLVLISVLFGLSNLTWRSVKNGALLVGFLLLLLGVAAVLCIGLMGLGLWLELPGEYMVLLLALVPVGFTVVFTILEKRVGQRPGSSPRPASIKPAP